MTRRVSGPVRIIDRIGTMYAEFGTLLLKDTYGMKLKTIIEVAIEWSSFNCSKRNIHRVAYGRGAGKLPVTWKTLIGSYLTYGYGLKIVYSPQ